jgi:hypothetical protein
MVGECCVEKKIELLVCFKHKRGGVSSWASPNPLSVDDFKPVETESGMLG